MFTQVLLTVVEINQIIDFLDPSHEFKLEIVEGKLLDTCNLLTRLYYYKHELDEFDKGYAEYKRKKLEN